MLVSFLNSFIIRITATPLARIRVIIIRIGFRSGVTVILTSDPALSTRARAGKENAGINF